MAKIVKSLTQLSNKYVEINFVTLDKITEVVSQRIVVIQAGVEPRKGIASS